jgi:hypothetical protein
MHRQFCIVAEVCCVRASKKEQTERNLVHMGTSALFIFRILKILKYHIAMSPKIMALKYIDTYLQEECIQKKGPSIKKYVVFWEI